MLPSVVSFNAVGDYTKNIGLDDGSLGKIAIHAMVGGLLAEATGGDFKTGALAAGANEALVKDLDKLVGGNKDLLSMSSQIVGVLAAASQEDADAAKMEKGAWVAQNATEYNFLNHKDVTELEKALDECKANSNCDQVNKDYLARSDANRERLNSCVAAGNCAEIRAEIDEGSRALTDLYTRQEISNPGGDDSKIAYEILGGRNTVDWNTAGQLHLEQTAKLWLKNDPRWMAEASKYSEQSGFSPFGINPIGLGGLASGKSIGKELMTGLKSGELPKDGSSPLKPQSSLAGQADAEAGMPYNHPPKEVATKGGAKLPKAVEEISTPQQAPVIPAGWVSRPGRNGGEIYFPAGTDPAKGEHIRVMPPGSSPVPGYENGYWRWQNSGKQPMNPATGKPGIGQGDTHVPLPPDSLPPVRR